MKTLNYNGLRKRDSYDEIVDYLSDQPKLVYPNRKASFLLNSPYLTQLYSDTIMEVEDQQQRMLKEQIKQATIRSIATQQGLNHAEVATQYSSRDGMTHHSSIAGSPANSPVAPQNVPVFNMAADDHVEGATQALLEDIAAEEDTSAKMAQHKQQQLLQEARATIRDIQQHPVAARIAEHATPWSTHPQAYAPLGGASSSAAPMEVQPQAPKRPAPESEHEPKGPRGRPRSISRSGIQQHEQTLAIEQTRGRSRGRKPMDAEGTQHKRGSGHEGGDRKKKRSEEEQAALALQDAQQTPVPPSPPLAPQTSRASHGPRVDENMSASYWRRQNMQYIKTQYELHGGRFKDGELSGRVTETDPVTGRKVIKRIKKLNKADILKKFFELRGIS